MVYYLQDRKKRVKLALEVHDEVQLKGFRKDLFLVWYF